MGSVNSCEIQLELNFSHFEITLLINCQRECLVLFRQDMVGMGGEINFDTYFSTQQTMTGTYVILGQHVLDA